MQTGPQWKPVKGKGEGIISRLGSGLCFDFANSTGDTALYYVGTEDGVVHKCSCSYNEQYLQNYHGHTGPVYKLRCHPLNPDVFISCSADWTIKLWNQTKPESFQQMDLTDVVSPAHSLFVLISTYCAKLLVELLRKGFTTRSPMTRNHASLFAFFFIPWNRIIFHFPTG